jgi:RNA polymerase sigma factor for flagellar operon FliA
MMEAFDHFQLNRGAQFTTYALPRIVGAIRDGLKTVTGRWREFPVPPEDMENLMSAEAEVSDQAGLELERGQMRLRLHGLLKRLTAREESVLRLHYLQGWTFKDIGQDLGITKGRVSQLHGQALERLGHLLAQVPRHDAFL